MASEPEQARIKRKPEPVRLREQPAFQEVPGEAEVLRDALIQGAAPQPAGLASALASARAILALAGVDINAGENCVPLPRNPQVGSMSGAIRHQNLHTAAYFDALLERLEEAQRSGSVRDALRAVAKEVSEGNFPF